MSNGSGEMTSPTPGPTGQPGKRALISLAFGIAIAVLIVGGMRLLGGHGTPQAHTITYAVDGGPADVTYGPAGSAAAHGSPMSVNAPDTGAAYYYVQAQLTDDGSVTCMISVDGNAVSQASASGAYRIAQCEIVPDGSGGWRSATG